MPNLRTCWQFFKRAKSCIYDCLKDNLLHFQWYIEFQFYCLCDLYGNRDFGMAVILASSRIFLLIIVSEVGQTYQQNGRKLQAEVFLRATIFCKHFDMVSKLGSWWDKKMLMWSSISLLPFTRSWTAANPECSQNQNQNHTYFSPITCLHY